MTGVPLAEIDFTVPSIAYTAILPILTVVVAAILAVLVEAFVPMATRLRAQTAVALVGVVVAFATVVLAAGTHEVTAGGALAVDGPALFMQGTILLLAAVAVLLVGERSLAPLGGSAIVAEAASVPGSREDRELAGSPRLQTEIFPLALFSIAGMLVFVSANDLLTMFIALEVLSLPLYLMCGLARHRRLVSQEAALKYFLLGAFSSAFFLYGLALLYGFSGSVQLGVIRGAAESATQNQPLLYIGVALLAVGLLFKAGAVPFHSWTPDVYQGAPTPVTAFMASCTKVAALGAILRVTYVAFGGLIWDWRPVLWAVAALSMLVGAIFAITQSDVKRMLAYSSVAHVGFLLVGVIALSTAGLGASMFYLVTYGFATAGAFAVVTLVRDSDGEALHLARWRGLGRSYPMVAAIFSLFLLAMAGIPLTSGFTGKFAVFTAATASGQWALVVVAVLASAIAAFFYVRVIVLMFFSDPASDGPVVVTPGVATSLTIAVGVAVTVVLGVYPSPLLELAQKASLFVQ